MIRLDRVSHRYAESPTPAIRDVSVEIERGDLILVTGTSGSGKTTVLRAMNGLVPRFHGGTFSGEVTVDGVSTLEAQPRDLAPRVGFVGQDPEIQSVVDRVEDDIAFTLENLAIDPLAMRKRVEEVMDALGISHLRTRALDTLSGGERQRVAIAGSMSAMPAYLVLDEPTSQLDPQSSEEVIGSVLRLRDENGMAIVLAEHRLERVLQYSDRLLHMDEGAATYGSPPMIAETGLGPPVVAIGSALGLERVPLELRTARKMLAHRIVGVPAEKPVPSPGDRIASLRRVEVLLGATSVLSNIDLDVHEGEVIAVMGRNGSGKTTLLRAISGLVDVSRGKRDVNTTIGFLPQNPDAILYKETVAKEIATTLRLNRLSTARVEIERVAEEFDLLELLDRDPRDLSGGQRTMVALAAATAARPQLVLLDEPTRGMDLNRKKNLSMLMQAWSNEGRRAIVLSTHDVELAAMAANRVVILSEGQIVVDSVPTKALSGSLTFSTQMNKVFEDPRILTVDDALSALGRS